MTDKETVIQKTVVKPTPVIEPPTPKEYLISIGRIILIVVSALVAYNTLKGTAIGARVSKIGNEVWITLTAGAVGAFWKFYTENEKVKIATAQANAVANAKAIQTLDSRVDSVLIQIQDLRSIQLDDTNGLLRLEGMIAELKEDIAKGRHQLLLERIELIQEFYRELCKIHSHISYNKGTSASIEKLIQKDLQRCEILEESKEPSK